MQRLCLSHISEPPIVAMCVCSGIMHVPDTESRRCACRRGADAARAGTQAAQPRIKAIRLTAAEAAGFSEEENQSSLLVIADGSNSKYNINMWTVQQVGLRSEQAVSMMARQCCMGVPG